MLQDSSGGEYCSILPGIIFLKKAFCGIWLVDVQVTDAYNPILVMGTLIFYHFVQHYASFVLRYVTSFDEC
jgi:hypothetical protein